jgi:hypothetical protein
MMTTRRDVMLSEYFKVPAAAIWGLGGFALPRHPTSTAAHQEVAAAAVIQCYIRRSTVKVRLARVTFSNDVHP